MASSAADYLKVTIICGYIFLQFDLKCVLQVLILRSVRGNGTGSIYSNVL
jgi:hypothetical protein